MATRSHLLQVIVEKYFPYMVWFLDWFYSSPLSVLKIRNTYSTLKLPTALVNWNLLKEGIKVIYTKAVSLPSDSNYVKKDTKQIRNFPTINLYLKTKSRWDHSKGIIDAEKLWITGHTQYKNKRSNSNYLLEVLWLLLHKSHQRFLYDFKSEKETYEHRW